MYLENDTEKQLARADAATAAIRMNRAALARFDIAEKSNVTCDNGCLLFPSKLVRNSTTQPKLKTKPLVDFSEITKKKKHNTNFWINIIGSHKKNACRACVFPPLLRQIKTATMLLVHGMVMGEYNCFVSQD